MVIYEVRIWNFAVEVPVRQRYGLHLDHSFTHMCGPGSTRQVYARGSDNLANIYRKMASAQIVGHYGVIWHGGSGNARASPLLLFHRSVLIMGFFCVTGLGRNRGMVTIRLTFLNA